MATMDSSLVAIHYIPSDGQVWAEYIQQKLLEYDVQCDLNDLSADLKDQIRSVNVNVFFLTPDFLDYPNWDLMSVMEKHSTILVLTGIDHDELEIEAAEHNCKHALEYYIYSLLDTEESVRDFLISTIALYEDNSGCQTKLHVSHSEPTNYQPNEPQYEDEEDFYAKLPSPRQINGIQDVIYKDGNIYLLLQRKPEGELQVLLENKRVTPYHTEYYVYEIPRPDIGVHTLSVLHDSEKIGECNIDIPEDESPEGNHQVPTTHLVETCSTFTQTDEVSIDADGEVVFSSGHHKDNRESIYTNIDDVGRSPSPSDDSTHTQPYENKLEKIRELLEDVTDPLDMLCQCLGLEKNIEQLDKKMTDMISSVETLRQLTYSTRPVSFHDTDNALWPTLVHFGAQFNMMNFCDVLLSNPLMFRACLQPNKDGHTPHDIAKQHGHDELAEHLKHFSEYVTAETGRASRNFMTINSENKPTNPRVHLLKHSHYSQSSCTSPHDTQSTCTSSHNSHTLCTSSPSTHAPWTPIRASLTPSCLLAEKERDSGISRLSIETPRLSTVSQMLPAPHRMSDHGYIRMSKEFPEDDVYVNEHGGSDHRHSTASQERVFSGSYEEVYEEDDIYIDMTPGQTFPTPKTPPKVHKIHARTVQGLTTTHNYGSPASRPKFVERHTLVIHDEDSDHELEHRRKDVVSMLGITPDQISPSDKKKISPMMKMAFWKKKSRSQSEPTLAPDMLSAITVNRKHKKHRCDSERSSGTSSTASTYSNSSSIREEDEKNVEMRDKKKAKKKMTGFLSKAKNRESMRIINVKADTDLRAPKLPPRKRGDDLPL